MRKPIRKPMADETLPGAWGNVGLENLDERGKQGNAAWVLTQQKGATEI